MKRVILLFSFIIILVSFKNETSKEKALRTLREADRAWCQSVSDFEKFMSFLENDVVWYNCLYPQLKGKDAVRSAFKNIFADKAFTFTWTPEQIEVSSSGDLGYTYGKYKVKYPNSTEAQSEQLHDYTTIWKKQKDSTWKVILEADF